MSVKRLHFFIIYSTIMLQILSDGKDIIYISGIPVNNSDLVTLHVNVWKKKVVVCFFMQLGWKFA